jgi:pimeloyl-ACP methyl ester carboxylesterase
MTRPEPQEHGVSAGLAYTRTGTRGRPVLVLLHALGSTRHVWDPVVRLLTDRYDVIAVDLPGFGESPGLPDDVEPHPAAIAAAVDRFLDDLGVAEPHLVGNSLGGWIALELAEVRPTTSVTLLSPAGLWRRNTPAYCRISLRMTRWLARHAERLLCWLVTFRVGRFLVLAQTHGRPLQATPEQAQASIRALGRASGFDAALRATLHRRYVAHAPITSPVTLAFGGRDVLLLRRQSRHLDELPGGTLMRQLPRCGHLPITDDPPLVAALIASRPVPAAP